MLHIYFAQPAPKGCLFAQLGFCEIVRVFLVEPIIARGLFIKSAALLDIAGIVCATTSCRLAVAVCFCCRRAVCAAIAVPRVKSLLPFLFAPDVPRYHPSAQQFDEMCKRRVLQRHALQ